MGCIRRCNFRIIFSLEYRIFVSFPQFASISKYFFYIAPQSQASGFTRVIFPRRGFYSLSELELQTQFPFSFFLKLRRHFVEQTVEVYPRLYRFSEEVLARLSEGLIRESPYRGESQHLLHLRDYQSFDPSRKIHWKASAKAEKLLVKEYQKEQGSDLYLLFDCFVKDIANPKFEKALELLVSLAFLFQEKQIDARIILPERFFETKTSIIPLLSYLATWSGEYRPVNDFNQSELSGAEILQLRSYEIPSRIRHAGTGVRMLFVEDWEHLMRGEGLVDI
jgi:uncharacterized protein (DUF58 family)